MRRVGRLLLGVVVVVLLLGVAGGGGSGGGVLVAVPLICAMGLVWGLWGVAQRRRPIVAGGWTPAAAVSYRPAAARTSASPTTVSFALARVEARELTTSTAFGVGLGFSVLSLVLFGRVWVGDSGGELPAMFELSPILAHPLAGMVVLAAFRARTRGRRDGVDELFETCPTSQPTRTLGHLLTGWAPAMTAIAFATAMAAAVWIGAKPVFGDVGPRQLAAVVGAGVLCVGAVCLGVALARWAPWTLVPVVAVIAVGFLSVELATSGPSTSEPRRQLSTWLTDPEVDLRLTAPHWVAHHLWILALVLVVSVLAVLRDRRGRAVLGAGAVAVALAVVTGVAATRPIDADDARRIAALVTDPALQPCRDAGELAVCTFEGDDALADALVDAVLPVATATPTGSLEGWSVRQGTSTDWRQLDPAVLALTGTSPPPDEHVIPIEFTGHPLALEGFRLWTGLAAVGVVDDWVPGTTLSIRGQARGVLALWLATRGASETTQLKMTSVGSSDHSRDANRPWPDTCFAGSPPAQWATTDVQAARTLLDVPEAEVRAVMLADWERWRDRTTTTDDLLAALDLAPVGQAGSTAGRSEC